MPQPKMKLPPGAELVEDAQQSDMKLPPGAELVPDSDFTSLPPGTLAAQPKAFTLPWVKEKANTLMQKGLDLLPTAGGIAGGVVGGGAGLETGPGAIATGAAGAAAGGGLGEVVREAGTEALFPNQPKLTAKESAKEIGKQAAIQGVSEATGRAGAKVFSPALNYFGKTAEESAKAGVRLLPSEATGKAPSYVEKFMKGSVMTSGKMDRFREMQNAETKAAVDKVADGIAKSSGTPEQLGKLVQDGIDQHTKAFRAIQKQMYDDIGTRVNERTQMTLVAKQVPSGLLGPNGKPLMKTVTTQVPQIVDDVMPSTVALKKFAAEELKKLDQLEKVLHPNVLGQSREMLQTLVDAPNNMTYSAMRAARSDTLAKVRELDQALAGKQAGLAKKMAELFDTAIMDGVKKSKIPGLEADVRTADAFTANEHRMFEQALVKKAVETKKPEALATLIRNPNMGNQETRDLFAVIPKQFHQPVQRQIILDTMRQSTNMNTKIFNERKFAETLGKIGDERGQIIFGPNWKNIKELTGIMERINGPVGMQGGAGAALQNFSILKNAMLLAIPGGEAASGHFGSAALSLGGEWASLTALASAMTHPQAAVTMLKVARAIASKLPYVATAAVNETGGTRKNLDRVKAEAKKLQEQKTTPPAPVSPPPTEAAPEPQSKAALPYTHIYNAMTGTIVPA